MGQSSVALINHAGERKIEKKGAWPTVSATPILVEKARQQELKWLALYIHSQSREQSNKAPHVCARLSFFAINAI